MLYNHKRVNSSIRLQSQMCIHLTKSFKFHDHFPIPFNLLHNASITLIPKLDSSRKLKCRPIYFISIDNSQQIISKLNS